MSPVDLYDSMYGLLFLSHRYELALLNIFISGGTTKNEKKSMQNPVLLLIVTSRNSFPTVTKAPCFIRKSVKGLEYSVCGARDENDEIIL
jgi:hypothetical protein